MTASDEAANKRFRPDLADTGKTARMRRDSLFYFFGITKAHGHARKDEQQAQQNTPSHHIRCEDSPFLTHSRAPHSSAVQEKRGCSQQATIHSTMTKKMADTANIIAQAKVKLTGISAHSFKCLGVAPSSLPIRDATLLPITGRFL